MSLKKVVTEIADKVEIVIGKGLSFLDGHIGFVIQVENDLIIVMKNPAADFALSSILSPQVVQMLPAAETLLQKAIAEETVGMQMEADVKAATTTEDKIKVIIAFCQANPGLNSNRFINRLCTSLLSVLNNGALSDEVYAFYLNAKKLLGA